MDTLLEQHYFIFGSIMVVFIEIMELTIYFTIGEDGLPKSGIQKKLELVCLMRSSPAKRRTVRI